MCLSQLKCARADEDARRRWAGCGVEASMQLQFTADKDSFARLCRLGYQTSQEAVDIPVIGNGDIRSPEDAKKVLETTGCDADDWPCLYGQSDFSGPFYLRGDIPEPDGRKSGYGCRALAAAGSFKGERGLLECGNIWPGAKGLPGAARLRDRINKTDNLGI